MKNFKEKTKSISDMSLQIADYISELNSLLQKIAVLTDDISSNYLEKINLKSERGLYEAEYDINIIKLKTDMLIGYVFPATRILEKLVKYSGEITNNIKELRE